jgi:hypothetical protein
MATKPPVDVVTQSSMDSFPASDPPGWIRTVAAPSESTTCPEETVFEEIQRFFTLPRVIVGGLVAGALITAGVLLYKRRA